MQYVRDNIEQWFRIVAVISMPQTAFAHTGAGVKSSVLFLRKHKKSTTENIENLKKDIQEDIKTSQEYVKKVQVIEKDKKSEIAKYSGNKKSEEFQEYKKNISEKYTTKINNLKDDLEELYIKAKQTKLDDYPIFMAIADDIGFDATGRCTGNNELEVIEKELARFIKSVIDNE